MVKRSRAVVDMSLRQSPDPKSPLYNEWHDWPAGTVFIPPKHLDVKKALERGIMEEVRVAPDPKSEIPGRIGSRPDNADPGEKVGGFSG